MLGSFSLIAVGLCFSELRVEIFSRLGDFVEMAHAFADRSHCFRQTSFRGILDGPVLA